MKKSKVSSKQMGNVSVPGVTVVGCNPDGSYLIHVTSRWGVLFEIILFKSTTTETSSNAPEQEEEKT